MGTEETFKEGLDFLQTAGDDSEEIEAMTKTICDRLRKVWCASEAVLTLFPSGTDAEFLPLLVALGRAQGGKVASIITCAGEVGSGTSNAAIGRHFSPLLPQPDARPHKVGESLFMQDTGLDIHGIELKLRRPDGSRMDMAELDESVTLAVNKALTDDGYAVVTLHMVAGSKTGYLMPSMNCMKQLLSTYGSRVVPVADACQVRMTDNGLSDLLASGFAVLATGSKFYGGPPFSGVVMMPSAMANELNAALAGTLSEIVLTSSLQGYLGPSLVPAELSALKPLLPCSIPNLGLLVRWHMALVDIEKYHAMLAKERCSLESEWAGVTSDMIKSKAFPTVTVVDDICTAETRMCKEASGMMPHATIVFLELKKPNFDGTMKLCTLAEAKRAHSLMARDLSGIGGREDPSNPVWARRCFLGQPVSLSADIHVLRIALGAPVVLRLHEASNRDEVQKEEAELVDKLNLILCSWDVMPL